MSTIAKVNELPVKAKDSRLLSEDGSIPVHSILMVIHSKLMADILKTIPFDVRTDSVFYS